MSQYTYLVDNNKKIIINCGNVSKDQFIEDFDEYSKFLNFIHESSDEELIIDNQKTLSQITLKDIFKILKYIDIFEKILFLRSRHLSLIYKYNNLDSINYNELISNLFYDWEIDNEKYKEYVFIE